MQALGIAGRERFIATAFSLSSSWTPAIAIWFMHNAKHQRTIYHEGCCRQANTARFAGRSHAQYTFGNHAMTFSRRAFLSASAGLTLAPWLGARAPAAALPRDVDVVVIGAGASGIAAARRI